MPLARAHSQDFERRQPADGVGDAAGEVVEGERPERAVAEIRQGAERHQGAGYHLLTTALPALTVYKVCTVFAVFTVFARPKAVANTTAEHHEQKVL